MALLDWQLLQIFNSWSNHLDQLLQSLSQNCCQSTLWTGNSGVALIPEIQVLETQTEIIIKVHLPHLEADSLELKITQETVLISGKLGTALAAKTYYDWEFYPGKFQSLIPLPTLIQLQGSVAELQDDILTLICQKAPTERQPVIVKLFPSHQLTSEQALAISAGQFYQDGKY